MTTIKYTKEQIKELKLNQNVKNATSKHIIFTKEFKIKAVKLAKEYITAKEIFKQFWFPEYIINSNIPSQSLARWKNNINNKWLIEEKKWRPKKEIIDFDKMTLEEQNEYLKTENIYLKELHKQIYWNYP